MDRSDGERPRRSRREEEGRDEGVSVARVVCAVITIGVGGDGGSVLF
jgi:hypothetical protein